MKSLIVALSILTINVAGLPDSLTAQNRPAERHLQIAKRARNYDVVMYQEDFYYSKTLRATHPLRHRPVHLRLWGVLLAPFFGGLTNKPGLSLYSRYVLQKPHFLPYSRCKGWTEDANDCWVPKGVQASKIVLPNGVPVWVVNTHMDAGNSSEVRESQVEQLLSFVRTLPGVRASLLIVGGDLNMNPHSPEFELLLRKSGLSFASGFIKGKDTVDYILLRYPENLYEVTMKDSGTALEFEGLSDHSAAFTALEIRRRK